MAAILAFWEASVPDTVRVAIDGETLCRLIVARNAGSVLSIAKTAETAANVKSLVPRSQRRTNRWTGATGSEFRIKRDPAKLLGGAVARSTQTFGIS